MRFAARRCSQAAHLLLTIWLYVRYAKSQSLLSYALALGAFALAILCKPSVVALPLALLLLDWWPLNRVNFAGKFDWPSLRPVSIVLVEKLPFLILALVATLVTFVGQRDLGLVAVAETRNLPIDLGRTALGYADYIRRISFSLIPYARFTRRDRGAPSQAGICGRLWSSFWA